MANRDMTPWSGQRGLAPFGRDPFNWLRREMDRLFDDFFAPMREGGGAGRAVAATTSWPSLDVAETEQAYRVTAELPGLEQKDVEVNLHDNVLTISGEKRQEHKEEDGGRTYAERFYGRFQRAIPFETEIDPDKVDASFKNGVLTVNLPKNPEAREKSRRIEVKAQ